MRERTRADSSAWLAPLHRKIEMTPAKTKSTTVTALPKNLAVRNG